MNSLQEEKNIQAEAQQQHSIFLPVLLLALAFLLWAGFQTLQLVREGSALSAAHQNQEQLVQNATRIRKSLDALAKESQKLADQGNPNARLLIDELKKRGVNIKTEATSSTPP